ncbi:MAG TPA: UDP-N-acetylmuramoyl-tripeptide--D-alanyl-D-alanine ligase [Pirellulales bacterium]|nr:UDP-N-acetylmuramoyl-tripeptide--D-alanyl-D-alanine ligase [Pirellulales bacterium]
MDRLTLHDLERLTGGRWLNLELVPGQCGDTPLGRVVIDSREVARGDVFWALPGSRVDGSTFASDAFARGAAGVVSESEAVSAPAGRWALAVADSPRALWQAAAAQRERFSGRVVGVTGSVGKTTTREMIHTVLGARYRGQASQRNHNNQIGVPLSLLAWRASDDYAVVELGASACGEIAELAGLAQPEMGVITTIGEAHLGGFGGHEQLAAAKGELLAALPDDGVAVLNGDDEVLRRLARRLSVETVWFGKRAGCQVVATDIRYRDGSLSLRVDGHPIVVPVWGRHHLTSVLAAVAVGRQWGLSLGEMADALSGFVAPPMRCQVTEIGGAKLINDCYNASPTSMRAALDLLREFDAPGRRIVVCGDMRELGPEESRWHRELGDEVVTRCGADLLVACGERAEEVVAAARHRGMPPSRALVCDGPLQAAQRVGQVMCAGDVVLVKGSRAMAMERFISALEGRDSTTNRKEVAQPNH